ncbi:MAG: hypothetical protein ACHQ9S_22050 [Candidatus Binatia bacterium]
MLRTVVILVGTLLLLASCGDEDRAIIISYRLIPAQGPSGTNGSYIQFVPPGFGAAPSPPEPLAGTFDVVRLEPLPPNTQFAFSIVRLQFSSKSYLVTGNTGTIVATFDPESPLSVHMPVSINGRPVDLAGIIESPDTFTAGWPPAFRGVVVLSEVGYGIVLFAAPVS